MIFYTYAHYRKDDGRLFYIGKGCGERYRKSDNRNRHWHRVVKKHGMEPKILAIWDSEKDALDHEKLLISIFRELGEPLTNITDGGEENAGRRHTEESKNRLRKAHTCAKRSSSHCESISRALTGRKLTPEWKNNLGIARTGMKIPKAYIPVYCETLGLRFNSVSLAACLMGIDRSHIVKVCKGKLMHTGGYKFRYD